MLHGSEYTVEGSIIQFACLDAYVATVLTYLELTDKWGGKEQQFYANRFISHVKEAAS